MYVYVCFTKCDCLKYIFSNTIIDHAVIQEFGCNQKGIDISKLHGLDFQKFQKLLSSIFFGYA